MAGIHITDIESAINWWRMRSPSPDGITACAEVRALAEVYALLVYYREPVCDEDTMPAKARDAWLAWYATTPDAPCIAICSTSQGDDICKGCGREEDVAPLTAEQFGATLGAVELNVSLRLFKTRLGVGGFQATGHLPRG